MLNKTTKICLIILVLTFLGQTVCMTPGYTIAENIETKYDTTPLLKIQYTPFNTPNINSCFKSYMDYKTITDKQSMQYKLIHSWGWVDEEGFMRCNKESEFGIESDYYLIALGSYYGTQIGTKYRITLDTGRIFYGVLADCKADIHTNSTNQYNPNNNNIVEFLVDTSRLNKTIKHTGTANVYMPLNGRVVGIEKMDFICEK